MFKPFADRTHAKMIDALMNQKAKGPEIHYYMIRGGSKKRNVTIWEAGKVGSEYIKTYGHYHVGKLSETYWIIYGEGIVLLQERKKDAKGNPIDNEIKSFKAISVKTGDKIFIPENTAHLVVNTGKSWLITIDDSPVNFKEADPVSLPGHADYEPIKKLHGFAYYVVEKNGKPTLVKNRFYKSIPDAKITPLPESPAL